MMAETLAAPRRALTKLIHHAQALPLTPRAVWAIWAVTRAILLANLILGRHYCDPQFYQYAGDFATGKLPYRAIPVEYPPLAIALMLLPALPLLPFSGIAPRPDANPHPLHPDPIRYGAYGVSFGIMMLLADALTLWVVMRFARRWTPGANPVAWSGALYTLLVFACGASLQKFDLVVGLLCVLAIWELARGRDGLAWAFLALATLTKGFPALLLPLFILWRVRSGTVEWGAIRRGIIGGALVAVAVLGPALVIGGVGALVHSVTYHTSRGVEIESVIASCALAVAWLPGLHVYTTFNPADLSRDVHSPLNDPMGYLLLVGLAFLAVWVYALWWRNAEFQHQGKALPEVAMLCNAALLLLLGFSLSFRALPVHYLLAIIPLAAVARAPRYQNWWLAGLAACLILSQVVINLWHSFVLLEPGPVSVMILRNASLVAASVLLARGAFFRADAQSVRERLT